MPGRKSTGILLFILSTASVSLAGIIVGDLLIGYLLIMTIVGVLIALVVLVYLSPPRSLSMNKP